MDVRALELDEWQTPATDYQVEQLGNYRLAKHIYQPGLYVYHGMDGYSLFVAKKPLISTTLMELRPNRLGTLRWKEWMVDSPTDYRAMQKYAENSYGNVLTTGLGLGLVTHELCKNDKVDSVTVVEISPEVINLISKYLPDDKRINVIQSDFWKFIEQDESQWDIMIVDLWVFWGLEQQLAMYKDEILPASEKLKSKYPETQMFFHGFAGMPTLEKLDEVTFNGDDTNPMVIDPLIYGLGEDDLIFQNTIKECVKYDKAGRTGQDRKGKAHAHQSGQTRR